MTKIRQKNLAKDAYNNPKNAAMLRKLESMEIKDGKVIIRVRAKTRRSDQEAGLWRNCRPQVLAPDSKTESIDRVSNPWF